ncbi:hypothetical protein ACVJBD_002917 [Rhizobium mongolense]
MTATLLSTMVKTLGRDALDTIISAREAEP